MDRKFVPPIPFLLILAIVILEIVVLIKFGADFTKSNGVKVFLTLLLGTLAAFIIYKKWIAPPPRCSLFYGPSGAARFDSSGNFIRYEDLNEQCGRKSVGEVKVVSRSRGRSKEYFCEWHDPEVGWMKNWLKKEDLAICPGTIKGFSITDDDDDEGPDIPL